MTWCIVQQPKYRKADSIIHQLCDTVAKNGNLLLNIGPRTDGSFHPDAVREIEAVGDWLRVCGEAIYRHASVSRRRRGADRHQRCELRYRDDQKANQGRRRSGNQGCCGHKQGFPVYYQKGGAMYAIALGWPGDGRLFIRTLARSAALLDVKHVQFARAQRSAAFYPAGAGPGDCPCPNASPADYAYALKVE